MWKVGLEDRSGGDPLLTIQQLDQMGRAYTANNAPRFSVRGGERILLARPLAIERSCLEDMRSRLGVTSKL
jgi:hypothetical protein